jgi:threonine dehydrogenase-like Zn-dependent dehydrogenase
MVDLPTPDPGPGEVLVRLGVCGVCASELHPWADGVVSYPHRFGHEPAGVVVAVGPEVGRFREGDRVTGLFNRAYADLCLADATLLLPIPDDVADENALGEPLACLVNAQRRTPVELADRVALIRPGLHGASACSSSSSSRGRAGSLPSTSGRRPGSGRSRSAPTRPTIPA